MRNIMKTKKLQILAGAVGFVFGIIMGFNFISIAV